MTIRSQTARVKIIALLISFFTINHCQAQGVASLFRAVGRLFKSPKPTKFINPPIRFYNNSKNIPGLGFEVESKLVRKNSDEFIYSGSYKIKEKVRSGLSDFRISPFDVNKQLVTTSPRTSSYVPSYRRITPSQRRRILSSPSHFSPEYASDELLTVLSRYENSVTTGKKSVIGKEIILKEHYEAYTAHYEQLIDKIVLSNFLSQKIIGYEDLDFLRRFITNKYQRLATREKVGTIEQALRRDDWILEKLKRQYEITKGDDQIRLLEKSRLLKELDRTIKRAEEIVSKRNKFKKSFIETYDNLKSSADDFDLFEIEKIVDDKYNKMIQSIGEVEDKMHQLGFIDYDFKKVVIENSEQLLNEIDFLVKRLNQSVDKLNNELNLKLSIQDISELNIFLDTEIKKYNTRLSKIIKSSHTSNLEEYSKIHPTLFDNQKSKNFTKKVRDQIDKDLKEQSLFLDLEDGYKKYQKEILEVKSPSSDSLRKKSVIRLTSKAKVFFEYTDDAVIRNQINDLGKNLSRPLQKDEIKVLYFSKYSRKPKIKKGDVVIDSLRKLFPKKVLSFIKNKTSRHSKRMLRKEFQRNKGNTIFLMGHIENGAIVDLKNGANRVSLSYIQELAEKNNVNYFIGGCSSSYYKASGTTDLINDLNFGVALANSYKNSKTYLDLYKNISNHRINGGIGEVKLILNNDSFKFLDKTNVKVMRQEQNTFWSELVNLNFIKNKITIQKQ